ncbi:MAG: carboxypeptidase-like regulatory domain-containing protein [Bryobacteraceae bacterium]
MNRAFLFLCAAAFGPCLLSQSTSSGGVSGVVTDEGHAVVSGATVQLKDAATGAVRGTTTNDAGRYTVQLPPGTYDLSISKMGFSVDHVNSQTVEVGLTLTIDATLKVGPEYTTIEVKAAAGSALQTMNATVGSTLSGTSLLFLPNLGRDVSTLATLQPAVTPTGSVAGVMNDQNTFQLDGGNITSDMDGNQIIYTTFFASNGAPTGAIPTPVESIEEFKVAISNQTADFNGASGGQIQLVTKRGANAFHGSAYEYYFATNIGAANTWKNNHTPANGMPYTALPVTHRNRFGAAIGGPLTPRFWGGRTYFFANVEGYRFPNYGTYERPVPSALMRAGVIQLPNSAGQYVPYNLNPGAVTVAGVTYQPAVCAGGPCDPRGLGLNPVVNQIWSKFMPLPNDPTAGDHFNTQGYLSTLATPERSNSLVTRIDHDFGDRWRFMSSYRLTRYTQINPAQVDIGGALPGDKPGVPAAYAPRVQLPSYLLAGLTTTISPSVTNDFRFNYTRNFWQWGTYGAPPQLPGLGGAVEIGGESANALVPYNVDAGDIRQRFWDGQDKAIRDDVTMLKGNHFLQFGGVYERNFDYHMRTDNGSGTVNWTVYQVAAGSGINVPSAYMPGSLPAAQVNNWNTLYAEVLGLVSQSQTLYTRQGPNLSLQPLGTPAFDQSIIPYYNVYFSDAWRMKPRFTLTYGMGYSIEMPPYEINGKQVEVVDQSGNPIDVADYLASRKQAALAGQVYNPTLGFATVANVGGGLKYPYHPFYGGFSPRIAAAWTADAKTVVRAGYGRIFARLNGVPQVLVPLLGTGLMQAIQCTGASRTGQCLGTGGVDPTSAFRIGTDGNAAPLPAVTQNLAQPYFPGVNGNASAGDGSALDPNFRPARTDNFTLTVQREISRNQMVEVGYIGRIIRNTYTPFNLDSVPYMTTLNGQSFAQAFANVYTALAAGQTPAPQPFLEAALGGASSSFCRTAANCTAAVVAAQRTAITGTRVYDLWAALNNTSSWTLGRTMPSSNPAQVSSLIMATSLGYANYNAAFVSWSAREWHGLTSRANFTWSRALGTSDVPQSRILYTPVDAWNLSASYGAQPYDLKFIYNQTLIYQPPYFRGQRGVVGHLLGGWTFSPLLTAQTGAPLQVSMSQGAGSNCQSFGEINCASGSTFENAALAAPYTGGNSANYNVAVSGSSVGLNGNIANGGSSVNMFANPAQIYSQFRRLTLGIDSNAGGAGVIRGFPTWNLDLTAAKDIVLAREGKLGATLLFQFTNVLNHMQPANPSLSLDSPQNFGVISAQSNTPRNLEFGLRIHF